MARASDIMHSVVVDRVLLVRTAGTACGWVCGTRAVRVAGRQRDEKEKGEGGVGEAGHASLTALVVKRSDKLAGFWFSIG